jgi:hypothetical protein
MDPGITKAELLETVQAEHAAWLALLDAIGEDRMLLPGAVGPEWTVKDAIAHLTAWREWSCARLDAGLRHTEPAPPWPLALDEDAPGGVDRINGWFYDAARDRPLATVLRESEAAWERMTDLVHALPEADLLDEGRFAWLGGAPLGAVVDGSLGHLHEHVNLLAIQGWQVARGGAG